MTHTPGPWLTEPGDTIISIRANGERVADVGGMAYWKRFTETDEANARLIAAAPDMLAALRTIAMAQAANPIEIARAAIAKATDTER